MPKHPDAMDTLARDRALTAGSPWAFLEEMQVAPGTDRMDLPTLAIRSLELADTTARLLPRAGARRLELARESPRHGYI
jgi:hypothetical protein